MHSYEFPEYLSVQIVIIQKYFEFKSKCLKIQLNDIKFSKTLI